MSQNILFKTSSPAGDLLSFMAGIRQMWKETGQKARIYQQLNVIGVGLQGVSQPFQNENGDSILMGVEMFTNIKPLIEAQEYVESYVEYKGEKVDIDLDDIRLKIFTGQPGGSLNRYPFHAFPQMSCDLSEVYLHGIGLNDYIYSMRKIVINFTSRYRNNFINYFFLKKYEHLIIFIGLPDEHESFNRQWGLEIEYMPIDNFISLASIILSSKFFMGNASMCFQIAEATKTPRILEIFQMMPNVIPVGANAYDAYHQSEIEFYFDKLINR